MASNGCFISVLIARTHDRVPLCTYTDEYYANSNRFRKQMQLILSSATTPASTTDRSAARGSYYESIDNKDCVFYLFQDSGTDLTIVAALNKLLLRSSGDVQGMNKLACSLLDTVFASFTGQFSVEEFSARNVRPYQFMKFETTLQHCVTKVIQEDRTSGAGVLVASASTTGSRRQVVGQHYDQLRQEITDTHFVMRRNLEDLMQRGERLESMSDCSAKLVEQSSNYYGKTVRMNRMRLIKLYGPPAVVGFILLVFFYFYLF